MTKVTTDLILNTLIKLVESKKAISKEAWLEISFKLNVLGIDEEKMLHQMQRAVAEKKLTILKSQEKRNVAAAELEVEASEEYQFMRDQESKVDRIDQFIMVAKKASETNF